MDAGSIVVVLGLLVMILGVSLMARGSRGAENEPPEDGNQSSDQ